MVTVVAMAGLAGFFTLSLSTTSNPNSSSTFVGSTSETESSQTCLNQSAPSTVPPGHFASTVAPYVSFNNTGYFGPSANFTVSPGSHTSILVNVSYPWQNVQPPPAQGLCLEFTFTVGPFPANSVASTIPSWMHVSVSPPSVDAQYGSSATVKILASVDSTAPQASGASFELVIGYFDPASGQPGNDVCVLSIET